MVRSANLYDLLKECPALGVLMQVATFLQKNSVFTDIRSVVMDIGTADSQPLQKQVCDPCRCTPLVRRLQGLCRGGV